MISAILFCLLSGPCDGGQCILPRHVITGTVEAVVKAPVQAAAKARSVVKARVAVRDGGRRHVVVKVTKVVLPPYRHK